MCVASSVVRAGLIFVLSLTFALVFARDADARRGGKTIRNIGIGFGAAIIVDEMVKAGEAKRRRSAVARGSRASSDAARIRALQTALAALGHYLESPNGNWDAKFRAAAMAFQRVLGNAPSGTLTSEEVLALRNETNERVGRSVATRLMEAAAVAGEGGVRADSREGDIRDVQFALIQEGLYTGPADGRWGRGLEQAVSAYHKRQGAQETGRLSFAQTEQLLGRSVVAPEPQTPGGGQIGPAQASQPLHSGSSSGTRIQGPGRFYDRPLACHLASSRAIHSAANVSVVSKPSRSGPLKVGEAISIQWSLRSRPDAECRTPLYLVLATGARSRFEGQGFLALPSGRKGPFDIGFAVGETRIFVPLHLTDRTSGEIKIKSYQTGPLALSWALVEVPRLVDYPGLREHFALGAEVVQPVGTDINVAVFISADPQIVVRDKFDLSDPRSTVRSKSGEFDLQIFDQFYRVFNVQTGELLLERAGVAPNFSLNSRFLGVFVEAGSSRNILSKDLWRPNMEVIDLYSMTIETLDKPAFLSWSIGDVFYAAGEFQCARNSCSSPLSLRQSLVDGSRIDLSGVAFTYKTSPNDFQKSISLETGLVNVQGLTDRSKMGDPGWVSLLDPNLRSGTKDTDKQQPPTRVVTRALLSQEPLFDDVKAQESSRLQWFAQGEIFALSHHCIPERTGACLESTDGRFGDMEQRVQHRVIDGARFDVVRIAERLDTNTRLLKTRSAAGRRQSDDTLEAVMQIPAKLLTRLDGIMPGLSLREFTPSERLYSTDIAPFSEEQEYKRHYESIERILAQVAKISPAGAKLIPSLAAAQKVREQRRQDSCHSGDKVWEKTPAAMPTNSVDDVRHWSSLQGAGWTFRASCSYGASGREWFWLLLAPKTGRPSLVNLSSEIGGDDWPHSVDSAVVAFERFLVANGTWEQGRWALVYDVAARKIIRFFPNLEHADRFGTLAITRNGTLLAQANTNGQLFIYDVRSGRIILRGVEADDELIVYDDSGYYMSTPEGGHFVHLKFPGAPGYSSVHQFARTLHRPDIIRRILERTSPPSKPILSPPPQLSVSVETSRTSAKREAELNVRSVSSVGLAFLDIYIDGRKVEETPVVGTAIDRKIKVGLPKEAHWISAVARDIKGIESVPQGQALPGAKIAGGRLFTISVGTDRYDFLGDQHQLTGAVRDAKTFMGMSEGLAGKYYASVVAESLIDDAALKSTLPEVLRATVQEAEPDDTIMLFAAGHGLQGSDGRFYLVTRSSRGDALSETGLSWDEIGSVLEGAKARVVVFLDACRSGSAGAASTNDDVVASLISRKTPLTMIAASKGRQDSEEGAAGEGGRFTTAVLRAVTSNRMGTDTNANGVIELAELYGAIKRDVLIATEGRQTPWIARNQMVGEVPLF